MEKGRHPEKPADLFRGIGIPILCMLHHLLTNIFSFNFIVKGILNVWEQINWLLRRARSNGHSESAEHLLGFSTNHFHDGTFLLLAHPSLV